MDSVSPVWTEAEIDKERIIALYQPEYLPIAILPIQFTDGTLGQSVRFRLTDKERRAIADGADIVITELTFGRQFTPLLTHVCMPGKGPFGWNEGE